MVIVCDMFILFSCVFDFGDVLFGFVYECVLVELWELVFGWCGWFGIVDYKCIGLCYIVIVFVFLLFGGVEVFVMCI